MKLILAPHADDETLGCGGLIAKDPSDVAVAVLSDKNDGRMDEYEAARKTLGYTEFHSPIFKTGQLADNARGLIVYLDSLVRNLRPTELYLPTPGVHQDHIATYEAGIRAARLSYTDGSHFVPNVYLYDVPSYTVELYSLPYSWNRFVTLSATDMQRKMDAIAAYASQHNGHVDPADLAKEHANIVGRAINTRFAERFAVVREVVA